MPGLQWVRLDSNLHAHDKILRLKAERDGWRAIVVYVQSLGWSGGHGTDGFIPRHVLTILDATDRVCQLLVQVRLWEHAETKDGDRGYRIRNYMEYQELAMVTAMKERDAKIRGLKGSCKRYHGPNCGCWEERAQQL